MTFEENIDKLELFYGGLGEIFSDILLLGVCYWLNFFPQKDILKSALSISECDLIYSRINVDIIKFKSFRNRVDS